MSAARFFPVQGADRHDLGHVQQVAKLPGVEQFRVEHLACIRHADVLVSFLQLVDLLERRLHVLFVAVDAHVIEHDLFHFVGDVEGVLLAGSHFLWFRTATSLRASGSCGQVLELGLFGILRRFEPRVFAEHHQVEQGVGAQAVRSVHRNAGAFARRIKPREDRGLVVQHHFAVFIGRDAAHGVMRRRLDRHHLRDRVDAQVHAAEIDDIGQFLEDLFAGHGVGCAVRVGPPVHRRHT